MLTETLKRKIIDTRTDIPDISESLNLIISEKNSNVKTKIGNTAHQNVVQKFINLRMEKLSDQKRETDIMKNSSSFWDFVLDYYFRLEINGWERLPDTASMLVGIHSGTWLTMDAWTFCAQWWRKYKNTRILNGTAHDVLMSLPGLGSFFRSVGVIPANRKAVNNAFSMGNDVIIWPGGELDAMRSWSARDKVVLGGRTGFIRQAIRSGVPIVPVATIGGTETVFVLSECRKIAKMLNCKKYLRSEIFPLVLGFPFGVTFELFPMHIPMPAKIRTEILEPVEIDNDPDRVNDNDYVMKKYKEIETSIQDGVNQLAKKRKLPIFF